jgi:hypothetical protein
MGRLVILGASKMENENKTSKGCKMVRKSRRLLRERQFCEANLNSVKLAKPNKKSVKNPNFSSKQNVSYVELLNYPYNT